MLKGLLEHTQYIACLYEKENYFVNLILSCISGVNLFSIMDMEKQTGTFSRSLYNALEKRTFSNKKNGVKMLEIRKLMLNLCIFGLA